MAGRERFDLSPRPFAVDARAAALPRHDDGGQIFDPAIHLALIASKVLIGHEQHVSAFPERRACPGATLHASLFIKAPQPALGAYAKEAMRK